MAGMWGSIVNIFNIGILDINIEIVNIVIRLTASPG